VENADSEATVDAGAANTSLAIRETIGYFVDSSSTTAEYQISFVEGKDHLADMCQAHFSLSSFFVLQDVVQSLPSSHLHQYFHHWALVVSSLNQVPLMNM